MRVLLSEGRGSCCQDGVIYVLAPGFSGSFEVIERADERAALAVLVRLVAAGRIGEVGA